jgi:hypothetical protein
MLILCENLPKRGRWYHAGGWFIFACLSLIGHRVADAQPASPLPAAARTSLDTNSPLKAISPDLYELGLVRLDKKRRTITFPAMVNLREGNIEYLVVTTTGKTHESLLRTEARPYHLQVALLLLGARGAGTNALPEDPKKPLPGDQVQIEVNWTDGRKTRRVRAEDFVRERRTGNRSKRGSWVFTGSRFREDGFAAEHDGSIVSLITDGDALINNPRPGREDDDNWHVRTNGLPRLGAAVSVIIKLVR